jgi:myo-inositol-1(or 4)-monophosphatase
MHPMLNIAIRAARAGGRVLTQYMDRVDSLQTTEKARNDFVTEVDRRSEAEIVNVLRRAYPDHAILGEEGGQSGEDNAPFKWFVDPLDGTTNYLHGYPAYCVSIAVAQHNRLEQAVVYNPFTQELFTASRGAGATLDEKRIRVSKCNAVADALLGTGFNNNGTLGQSGYLRTFREFNSTARNLRRQGAAALDLAYVAAGRLDGFWEFGLQPWDTAAGALLVREAGGLVGTMSGGDDWLESGNIVAASPRVYDSMLRTFSRLKATGQPRAADATAQDNASSAG